MGLNNITSNVMTDDNKVITIDEKIKEVLIFFSFDSISEDANSVVSETYNIPNLLDNLDLPLPDLSTKIADNSKLVLDAMTEAAKTLSEKPPVFKDTDCETDTKKLCDEQSLSIDKISIPSFQKNNWTYEGYIEESDEKECFFPEDDSSNNFGFVTLENDEDSYCLTIPISYSKNDYSSSDEIVGEVGESKETFEYSYDENNKFTVTNTSVSYDETDPENIKKTTAITKWYYYYNSNYEISFDIRNEETDIVSTLIGVLNINIFGDKNTRNRENYQNLSNYDYVFDLKTFDIDATNLIQNSIIKIILAKRRIFLLAHKELVKSKVLKDTKSIISQLDENPEISEPNPCLLDEKSEEQYVNIDANTNKLKDELNKINNRITDTLKLFEKYEINEDLLNKENDTVSIERNKCPVLCLNEEEKIGVYLINKKLQLQVPPTILNRSVTKQIIDYELKENTIYMLKFKILSGAYELELITSDKQTLKIRGSNFNNIDLFPTLIASDGINSFCGFTLYDVVFGNGRIKDTTEIYKESVLGYIPDTSQLYFDFTNVKYGKVINNLINITNNPKQQARAYGNIMTNGYTSCLDGMVDNFFCREAFIDTSFSICFWVNGKMGQNNKECVILSDDIGSNYIKYKTINEFKSKIIFEFGDESKTLDITGTLDNKWTLFCLKYELNTKKYVLDIQSADLNSIYEKEIESNASFRLMSIFSRYDYRERDYVDNFNGYLTLISIYFSSISNLYFNNLFKEQSIFVDGLMTESSIINNTQQSDNNQINTESVKLIQDDQLSINNQSNIDYLKGIAGFSDDIDKHDLEKLLKGN